MDALSYGLVAALAYLLGSIPTGAIVARVYRNVDLTRTGSARTGATNTTRVLGLGAGLIVFAGDFSKGAAATWLAGHLVGTPGAQGLALLCAVLGHNRSIFLRGRGGRGVLTGLGGLSVASTGVFMVGCLTGCVVAASTRYISLGSIAGCAATIVAMAIACATGHAPAELALFTIVTAAVIIAAHADNIARLRQGTERRLGTKGTAETGPHEARSP